MSFKNANKISFLFPLSTYDGFVQNLAERIEEKLGDGVIYDVTKYRLTVIVASGAGKQVITDIATIANRSIRDMYSTNTEIFISLTKDDLSARANDIAGSLFTGGTL